jgi:hypothetical protein
MGNFTERLAERAARLIPSVLAEETAAAATSETSQGGPTGCINASCFSVNARTGAEFFEGEFIGCCGGLIPPQPLSPI